ncbi:MAG: hypothetical protein KDB53_06695, partial [Planctomycetes bacterium]|nr:hypothetical protein [Planctomycetota bacterium]
TNMGWTVVNDPTLTGGAWGRGVPVGGGDRGDPATDGDGSGACFLTENVDGNSDVDGGATRLISPVIYLSLYPDARISWLFWYDNAAGGNPNSDVFVTEITNNGINWQLVESYNANAQAWLSRSLQVSDFVTPSSSVQIRFTASDPAPNGSVVEAGIDGFAVDACPAGGLGFCANGMVGFAQGGPFDVIFVDGSAGGSDRRATVPMGSAYSVSMNDVPGLFTNMPFVIFGTLGEPLPNSEFSLGPLVGSLCFTPCVAQPFDPNLFLLADTVGIGGCQPILPSNPTPWSFTIPPFPFAYTMTLQPVVQATSLFVWVGNAVVIDYGM